jgi:superfamily I DNA/RNA helicase
MALPQPVGRQREVLYLPAAGHIAVLGTAGSGKTTLAILRAAYLSDSSTDHAGSTLLVTFNRALVTYLRSIGSRELRNVTVENYHKFARGYLSSRGKMTWSAIIDSDGRIELIKQAIANVKEQYGDHTIFSKPTEFIAEEVRWIAQSGINTAAAYHQSPPTLPGDLVAAEVLPLLWQILEEYWRIRSASGKQYDWDDIAAKVCEELSKDTKPRRYKHVIIDEGQDFSPMMIKSLVRAVPADGSVTFFGDVAQQIYGSRLTWRSAGLNLVGEPWMFRENYRNTREIAELALAITHLPHYQGAADLVVPTTPRAAGPKPSLVLFSNENEEIKFVVDKAIELSVAGSVGILTVDHAQRKLFNGRFRNGSYTELTNEMATWRSGAGLSIGTLHAAKGLEFDSVLIPRMSAILFPQADDIAAFGEERATLCAAPQMTRLKCL